MSTTTSAPTEPICPAPDVPAVLRGTDRATGTTGTWHLRAVPTDGATCSWVVEHVGGHIMSEAVWMQTHRDVDVVDQAHVLALLARVDPCC
ncbi:hypothetical protein [Cellulomonas sp. SLBN-39]|uniref:hypothetical protein n=1 Tax=Cellulomonas sp. SLBN-39 TaxID=2768446 RepID=UPI0011518D94|nr:hypothetical protein [Cellulomonas sp. SLBN-39]TQL04665.1 hypothetical protein FBY24_3788 [Cellulomonas sp. SLBN-39]